MAAESLVTDPTLFAVLDSASQARQTCLEIVSALDQLYAAGGRPLEADMDELLKKQNHLNARLAQLRGLNRKAIMGVRGTKQETTEARQEIDTLHLQLQNLYYEQRHLHGEISACEDYDHTYQQLPMISTDEFHSLHPEYADASDHDLTIARIQDEHAARQALEEQRQQLVKRKDALLKETNAKKDELGRLDSEAEKWINGAENVRKLLEAHEKKVATTREAEQT